jgi:glycosyltransferase involved in cell wall biosynthesis
MNDNSALRNHARPYRRLRIIILGIDIIDRFLFVGYYSRLFIALAKRGHMVTWTGGRTSRGQEMPGFPMFKLETFRQSKIAPYISRLIFQMFALWKMLGSVAHYDVLIFDNVRSPLPIAVPVLLIRRLASHRPTVLLRITTNPQETGSGLRDLLMHFEDALSVKLSAIFFDGIFFISPMMAQMYMSKFRIPRAKIGIWPPAVDEVFFAKPSKLKIEHLRKELDPNGLLVIYHGYLSKARGLTETARAFKLLKDASIRAKLILLGDGPIKDELLEYVSRNRLDDVIKLLAPVDYTVVPEYIAACDVGIIPLPDHEWFRYQCPIKLLEYLAMGKPVIVSNIPANTWVVSCAPVASFLEGTSSNDIAEGVKRFIASRNNLNPEDGIDIARAFSTERMAESIELQILSFARRQS